MRRFITAILAIAALTVPVVAVATAGAAGKKHIHFTTTASGALISGTQAVYKVHDTLFGNGASVQTTKSNAAGTGGTDSETTYYAHGSARSKGIYKLSAPDANGIIKITGTGHDVGGTGAAAGLKSSYTFSGTLNTKTLLLKIVLKGTYTR